MKKKLFAIIGLPIAVYVVLLIYRGNSDGKLPDPMLEVGGAFSEADEAGGHGAFDSLGLSSADDPVEQSEIEEWVEVGASSNRNMSFFGRVVDEEGVALEGVEVVLRAHFFDAGDFIDKGWTDSSAEWEVLTGADGEFSLEGVVGSWIRILSITKEGYRLLPASELSFHYDHDRGGPHVGDSSDPVVFSMWRNRGAEGVVRYNRRGRIPYDGTAVHFDLEKGRLGGGTPDLRISLLRDPLVVDRVRGRFDWVLRLEVPEGGIVPITGMPTWEAPDDGYEPTYDLVWLADSPDWKREDEVVIFVKARGGELYGRVRISVRPWSDQPTTGISFEAYVNPNGSRILEPK